LALATALFATAAGAQSAPSGQAMALWQMGWERLADTDKVQLVIRALAPKLANTGYDAGRLDMDWICATHGIAMVSLPNAAASQIVVNLADRPVPRGTTDPEATQYFGLYRVENSTCIWEEN
jgi:hypothetical protein